MVGKDDICAFFCAIVIFITSCAIIYFTAIGSGIGISYIINHGEYNMHNGTSLTPGDKSILGCYFNMKEMLFNSCIWYGAGTIAIAAAYGLWAYILLRFIHESIKIWTEKSDEETTLIETNSFLSTNTTTYRQIILGLLVVIIIYPITCILGLGVSITAFSGDYNMTTGWLKSGDVSTGRVVCYNDRGRSFLISCIPYGIGGWAIIAFWLFLLFIITSPIVIFCKNFNKINYINRPETEFYVL